METKKRNVESHPLEIDVIFDGILRYLSEPDIFSCRQVCRKWTECTATKVQSILENCPPQIFFKNSGNTKDLREYSAFHTLPTELLVNFHLEDYSLIKDAEELEEFFDEFGYLIKKLKLAWNPEFKNLVGLNQLGNLVGKCTELETLIIGTPPGNERLDKFNFGYGKHSNLKTLEISTGASVSFYRTVFTCFPNLRRLSVGCKSKSVLQLHVLPFLPKGIKELGIFNADSNCYEILLGKSFLQLESFETKIILEDKETASLKKFLESQKEHLESLSLDIDMLHEERGNSNILRILGLKQGDGEGFEGLLLDMLWNKGEIGISRLSFPECMPKLKKLRIGNIIDLKIIEEVDFPVVFPSLKYLILEPYVPGDDCEECLSKFLNGRHPNVTGLVVPSACVGIVGRHFPNIKDLVMQCIYDNWTVTNGHWEMWPDLESLHLSILNEKDSEDSVPVDEVLTGLDDEEEINEPMENSIALLKGLKALTIKSVCGKVSDRSVNQALCKLPLLDYLNISPHQISEEATVGFCNALPGMRKCGGEKTFVCRRKGRDNIPHPILK